MNEDWKIMIQLAELQRNAKGKGKEKEKQMMIFETTNFI